jgi:hypothetical protein
MRLSHLVGERATLSLWLVEGNTATWVGPLPVKVNLEAPTRSETLPIAPDENPLQSPKSPYFCRAVGLGCGCRTVSHTDDSRMSWETSGCCAVLWVCSHTSPGPLPVKVNLEAPTRSETLPIAPDENPLQSPKSSPLLQPPPFISWFGWVVWPGWWYAPKSSGWGACILYGRTQHRLSMKSRKEDPTNMLGYETCNGSCRKLAQSVAPASPLYLLVWMGGLAGLVVCA